MNLKEKLADDAVKYYAQDKQHDELFAYGCGFIAGFEKAREMAYHQSIACVKTAPIDILNLGEEEVE